MYGLALGRAGAEQPNSIQNAALGILRLYGTDAHVYLPGSTQVSYGAELWGAPTTFNDGTVTADGLDVVFAVSPVAASGGRTVNGMTGKTFNVTYTLTGMDGADQARMILYGDGTVVTGTIRTANGTYTEELTPSTAGGSFTNQIRCQSHSGGTMRFSAISVREKITTSSVTAGLPTNNYTLSNGSTGYSAVDGTAGLVLDAAGAVGAELASTSSITLTGTNAYTSLTMTASPAVGKTYLVTYSYNLSSGSIQMGSGGSFATGPVQSGPSSGTYSYYAVGNGTTTTTILYCNLGVGTVTNISIKEVTGIHATQSTTANKPALRRGLYNLLTYSNTFSNAAWTKTDITVANDATDSTGFTNGAWTVTEGSAGTSSFNYAATGHSAGATLSQARVVKRGNTDICRMVTASPAGNGYQCWFNLATGAKLTSSLLGTGTGSADIVALGNGFYLLIVTATIGAADTASNNNFYCTSANNVTTRVNGATHIIERAGLFQGTLTAAQILAEGGIPLTTSAAASNQSAGRYSWQFDGTNDSLALGSVPFQANDDWAIVVGARADSIANSPDLFSIFGNGAGSPVIRLAHGSAGTLSIAARDDAAYLLLAADPASTSVGEVYVATGFKRSAAVFLRKNGTQKATQGGSTFGAATLTGSSIGARLLTVPANYLTGSIGPVIVIKGTISDSDLLTLERWVASQTPNGPTF